jgi:hypothetical protein
MTAPTLVYFDFPVRAEVARLLFTLGKLDFEVSAGSKAACIPDAATDTVYSSIDKETSQSYCF